MDMDMSHNQAESIWNKQFESRMLLCNKHKVGQRNLFNERGERGARRLTSSVPHFTRGGSSFELPSFTRTNSRFSLSTPLGIYQRREVRFFLLRYFNRVVACLFPLSHGYPPPTHPAPSRTPLLDRPPDNMGSQKRIGKVCNPNPLPWLLNTSLISYSLPGAG
jgi:hypothetical protein